jgi:hypothetical protein
LRFGTFAFEDSGAAMAWPLESAHDNTPAR